MTALGMLEVKGYVGAIEVADVMAKVANIVILDVKKTNGQGWMTVFIEGDVAAVQSATQAGTVHAKERECFVAAKVIPRPATDVKEVLVSPMIERKKETETLADAKKTEPPASQISSEIKEQEIEKVKEKVHIEVKDTEGQQPEKIEAPQPKTTNTKSTQTEAMKKNVSTRKQSQSGNSDKK